MLGKVMIPLEQGPRRLILGKERFLTERFPGPLNREPWAGTEPLGFIPRDVGSFWRGILEGGK